MTKALDFSKIKKSFSKTLVNGSFGFHDPTTWVSSGNYALNYIISGDFNKAFPLGKVAIVAGDSGAGKSYIVSGNAIKDAQQKGIFVILIDTENALDESWLNSLGVDTAEEKLMKVNIAMIDDVASFINAIVTDYKSTYDGVPNEERQKILIVIDSIGMLMTPTDVAHFEKGDLKGDMGRKPKALKALVTNCTNLLGSLDIGLLVTNHCYESQDMFDPTPKITGGCLVENTKVLLEDGTYKNIQDCEKGDIVQTLYGADEIINTWKYEKETYTIELDDGYIIECSPEHKFLVNTEEGQIWVKAEELTEYETLISVQK